MGKKSSTSQPSSTGPTSPTTEIPRMDPPPPYETVSRGSSTSSVRSTDGLNPDRVAAGTQQPLQQQNDNSTPDQGTARSIGTNNKTGKPYPQADGGCMNLGENTQGCMNYGDNTNGCMNYGDGTDGCMNYKSTEGCMNYKSTGGCMNYEVSDDWHGNEGCMNYKRGGGCMLWGN